MVVRRLLIIAALIIFTSAAARADDYLPEVKSIGVGFDNVYKLGSWTPVAVGLGGVLGGGSGEGGQLHIEASDSDGVPALFPGPRLLWANGGTHLALAKIGRPGEPLKVLLQKTGGLGDHPLEYLPDSRVQVTGRALPATNELILQLGGSIGLPEYFQHLDQSDFDRTTVVTLDKPQPLPDKWYGYEGVDLVVIVGLPAVKEAPLMPALLTPAAIDALEQWVRLGGTLLLECGEGAERVVGPGAPLARFAPGDYVDTVESRPFNTIESYVSLDDSEKLDLESFGRRAIRVPEWSNLRGNLELGQSGRTADLAFITRRPLGFGQVIFVGFDLHAPPFDTWLGRGKFLEKLLKRRPLAAQAAGASGASLTKHLGYVDISGQLRSALDQFDGVRLVPFWALALLSIGYIALLFPLNYLVAGRWLKRPYFAWIFFPAAVLVFCGAAYAMTHQFKGDRLRAIKSIWSMSIQPPI